MMKEGLRSDNYYLWFKTLLQMEEMQCDENIIHYSSDEAELRRSPNYYQNVQCVRIQASIR